MRRSARAAAVAPVACVALVTGIVGELNGPAESGDTNRAPAVGAVGGERVPVYDSPEARWTVGTIQGPPGSVACQDQFLFEPYDAHGRVSDWWVQARADNGRWGVGAGGRARRHRGLGTGARAPAVRHRAHPDPRLRCPPARVTSGRWVQSGPIRV